jgi:hypothetical protein
MSIVRHVVEKDFHYAAPNCKAMNDYVIVELTKIKPKEVTSGGLIIPGTTFGMSEGDLAIVSTYGIIVSMGEFAFLRYQIGELGEIVYTNERPKVGELVAFKKHSGDVEVYPHRYQDEKGTWHKQNIYYCIIKANQITTRWEGQFNREEDGVPYVG